jgi:hypothetical protein
MIELLVAGGTVTTASLVGQTLVARTLLGQILERMADYVIDAEHLEPYLRQGVNAGYRQIPARFTPGPRRSANISS